MNEETGKHTPVLLDEVLANLITDRNGIYVDATFGRGGHSQAILDQLSPTGRLIAIDKDLDAVAHARRQFAIDKRFTIEHCSFANLQKFLERMDCFGHVSGILFDLGVSSPQLDEAERGFSFMREGKLDMRMNTTTGMDAAQWLQNIDEEDLANVLFRYGEERYSRRIARSIKQVQAENPITNTKQLAEIVSAAIPRWEKGKHPATRSFLAIRIAVNHELEDLELGLAQSLEALTVGGRLAVISFHSIEDRMVKHFIQHQVRGDDFPPGLPVTQDMCHPRLKRLGKAIKPGSREVAFNPRARSAVLRIAEKLL
ncbi:MAG: 16S rRNA (cytosine(1402)-N(4))-methyltransferase RsmH [Pseudomonadota bacterium]